MFDYFKSINFCVEKRRNMEIIIVANFTNSQTSRFIEVANMFAAKGHTVSLLTSDFDHGSKKTRVSKPQNDVFKTVYIHEPGYKGNVTPQRLWSHHIWGLNVVSYLKKIPKPDVVYCAIPSLTVAVEASKYCKRNGVKFVVDVQDLWPEAFSMVFKNKLFKLAFKPMEWYINKAYASADLAIAVSDTYVQRVLSVNKKITSGMAVFLGNSGKLFEDSAKKYRKEYNDGIIRLCYIGSLSQSYDIKMVVDAVKIASNQMEQPIRFVVVGDGVYKNDFESYAELKKIDCEFTGHKDYTEMVGILCSCDMVINPIRKGSAASIINKVGDYALSGLPVINTQECSEYRKLIEDYSCGINCECGNAEDVAAAIVKLAQSPELRKEIGETARQLGKDKFDRRYTYAKIIEAVENLGNTKK